MVLTSGRGRGKSSSLGFISDELLSSGNVKVLITAPRFSVTDPVFYHLDSQNKKGVLIKSNYTLNNSQLNFIAPDALLKELPSADVLLVDEAAAIPISILSKLLENYFFNNDPWI